MAISAYRDYSRWMSTAPSVAAYIDYKSPYVFAAKDRIYALADETGAAINWRPYVLNVPQYPGSATVDNSGAVVEADRNAHQWRRIRYAFMDCRRQARKRGLILRSTQKMSDSASAAAGMLFAQDADEAVFRHYNDTIFVRFRKRDLDIKNIDALAAGADRGGCRRRGLRSVPARGAGPGRGDRPSGGGGGGGLGSRRSCLAGRCSGAASTWRTFSKC